MRKIIFGLIFLILINSASAYTYLNIYLDETGEALFLGETNEQLQLPEGVDLDGKEILGKTQSLTSKQGKIWNFLYSLENAEMNIYLPKNAIIKKIENGEISTKNDQIIVYARGGTEIDYVLAEENSNFNSLLYLSLILAIVAVLVYFWKSKQTKKNKNIERLNVIKQTLNEREKKIIEKLEEVKEIKHSRLQKILEMPKASFSRHVQELEKKDLIKREGKGRNKILSLK